MLRAPAASIACSAAHCKSAIESNAGACTKEGQAVFAIYMALFLQVLLLVAQPFSPCLASFSSFSLVF